MNNFKAQFQDADDLPPLFWALQDLVTNFRIEMNRKRDGGGTIYFSSKLTWEELLEAIRKVRFTDMIQKTLTIHDEPLVRLWAHIEGGVLQWVHSDGPVRLLYSDMDTDGVPEEDLMEIEFSTGKEKALCSSPIIEVNPDSVNTKYQNFLDQLPF